MGSVVFVVVNSSGLVAISVLDVGTVLVVAALFAAGVVFAAEAVLGTVFALDCVVDILGPVS